MKKIVIVLSLILLIGSIFVNYVPKASAINYLQKDFQQDISKKLIRFHVLANSDSEEDQELKKKVRDEVIAFIYPKLNNSSSIEESRKILKDNDEEIKRISQNIIKKNSYNYSISTTLDYENFPVKNYGNITLPQGRYEAYRIIIGEGRGQNWWCVMFPPLCFIDITKEETHEQETEKQMKRVLNNEEYQVVADESKATSKGKKEVKFRFKILDTLKEVINKLKS